MLVLNKTIHTNMMSSNHQVVIFIVKTLDIIYFFPHRLMDLGLLIIEASRSHSDTPHSEGFLWTSDQPDTETST